MMITIYLFAGLLGLLIGSFLNVVVLRLHTKTITRGRSKCASCAHTLSGSDLVPVFSFVFLFGRCRYCKSRLSWQYPIVEILTALVYVGVAYRSILLGGGDMLYSIIYFVYFATVFSFLIALSAYDIRHYVLPWKLMRPFLFITFLGGIFIAFLNNDLSFTNFVAGFVVAFPFWVLWHFSKGRLIGFGDILLMMGFGFMFGILGGFSATMFGFWIGAVWVLLKMLFTRTLLSGKTQIPFGPFLVAGAYAAFISGLTLNSLALVIM